MNKKLSGKLFAFSQISILFVGLLSLWLLYVYLYPKISGPLGWDLSPITKSPTQFRLDVSNPGENVIVFEKSLLISGQTAPKSTVIVSSDNYTAGIESDNEGSFSTVLELTPGLNEIEITAFDTQGNPQSLIRPVYYSEEKL